jgi:hypothetical protein
MCPKRPRPGCCCSSSSEGPVCVLWVCRPRPSVSVGYKAGSNRTRWLVGRGLSQGGRRKGDFEIRARIDGGGVGGTPSISSVLRRRRRLLAHRRRWRVMMNGVIKSVVVSSPAAAAAGDHHATPPPAGHRREEEASSVSSYPFGSQALYRAPVLFVFWCIDRSIGTVESAQVYGRSRRECAPPFLASPNRRGVSSRPFIRCSSCGWPCVCVDRLIRGIHAPPWLRGWLAVVAGRYGRTAPWSLLAWPLSESSILLAGCVWWWRCAIQRHSSAAPPLRSAHSCLPPFLPLPSPHADQQLSNNQLT